ncbi:MAG: ParB/RepB/Spo0J family partition protein [Phycisphaeraceae bacterium]|nr:MAG: ParB/RepB/Spo0J family partition protein [Phycisphaeraceae bacterium]
MGSNQAPRKLGKGLAGLLNAPAVEVFHVEQSEPGGAQKPPERSESSISLELIDRNPEQPRTEFDVELINQLAASIQRSGVLQPIVVRPSPVAPGRFQIVAGERRYRAAKIAGLVSIPATVRILTDSETAEIALTENLQREDLNPMDRAWGLRKFAERFNLSHGEVADRVGFERPTVANLIRLTELEASVGDYLASGALSAGHGKALLGAPSGSGRETLAKQAVLEGWSVRQTEAAAKRLAQAAGGNTGSEVGGEGMGYASNAARDAVMVDLQRRLGQFLGTKVEIRPYGSAGRGAVVIDYYGLDHFDGLMRKIGFDH